MKYLLSLTLLTGIVFADFEPVVEIPFKIDGRPWKEGFAAKEAEQGIIEYVVSDENVNNWNELVTTQYFFNAPDSAEQFYNRFIKLLQEGVDSSKLKTRIISKDANSVLAEWTLQGTDNNDQHEWIRIIKQGDSLVLLHYVTKNLNEIEKRRPAWEQILNQTTITQWNYSNKDYSLKLPPNWQLVQAPVGDLVKEAFEDDSHKISLQSAEIANLNGRKADDLVKEASSDLNLWGEFDKQEKVTLDNGQEFDLIVYKPRKKFRDYETVSMLAPIVSNSKIYLFVATVPADDAGAKDKVVNVLKTFSVK